MNLEVDGTKQIVLVEDSQGLSLTTETKNVTLALAGVTVKGPQGVQGATGATGATGVISATSPIYYNEGTRSIYADIGTNNSQLVIGSDYRLSNTREPSNASVTDAKINGTLSQSKITNLSSDLSLINQTVSNKSGSDHTHVVSGDVTGILGFNPATLTLSNSSTARSNLGLGDSATKNVGSGSGQVAAGIHTHTLNQITDIPVTNPAAALSVGTTTGTVAAGDHTHSVISNFVTINGDSSGSNALNALSVNNKKINHLADPISDDDAATKSYVDRVSVGIQTHDPARLATTGSNITLSGSQNIDGVAVVGNGTSTSNRILVKDQTDAKQNGIYYANTSGAWVRATDMSGSTNADWKKNVVGAYVYVNEGSTLANVSYLARVANVGTETIGGSTGDCTINFGKFSSLSISAGDGISISGPTISAVPSNSISVSGGIAVIPKTSGGLAIDSGGLYISSVTNAMLAGGIQIGASGSKVTGILPLANGGLAVDLSNSSNLSTARTSLGLGTASVKDYPSTGNASGTTNGNSQVVLANDGRLTDSRTPSGSVGGGYPTYDLTGTYPNPALNATGVSAGTNYTKFSVDGKGRVTSATSASPSDIGAATAAHPHVFRTSHNFIIQGNIVTSAALAIPPFFAIHGWPTNSGINQTDTSMILTKVYYVTGSGLVDFQIKQNGGSPLSIGGNTTNTASSSANSLSASTTITDGDQISLYVSGISGSPQNLTVTLVFEHRLN